MRLLLLLALAVACRPSTSAIRPEKRDGTGSEAEMYATILVYARGAARRAGSANEAEGTDTLCWTPADSARAVLALAPGLRKASTATRPPANIARDLGPGDAKDFVTRGLVDRVCTPGGDGICHDSTATMNVSLSEPHELKSDLTAVTLMFTRDWHCRGDGKQFVAAVDFFVAPDSTGAWAIRGSKVLFSD